MNPWWLALVPVALLVGMILGAFLTFWYFAHQLKKNLGIKSWKEFQTQIKKAQKLQEQMKKGHFQMDEDLRKQMEEIAKRFSQ